MDLFVSYAHETDPQWARVFIEQLRNRVGTLLGRPADIYFDERKMEQGASVSRSLLDAVTDSRLLLVILSPKYLASPWCLMELSTFLEAGEDAVAHRIFVVEAERIDRAQWPAALRDRETIAFWQEDPVTSIPERLDPELGDAYAQLFKKRIGEIAHFIRTRLQADDEAPPQYRGDVWIAEPTDDLVNEWEELAAAIRQNGWRVLPSSPYPTHDLGAYTQSVRRHLSTAQLCVQLLGPTPGRRPGWGGGQFPLLQANEARATVQKRIDTRKPGVRWLRWRKNAVAQDDPSAYAGLLREGEVQESSFGDFKSEVIRHLTAPDGPLIPVQPAAPVAVDDTVPVQVYVHSDEIDRPLAEEIMQSLVPLNVYCMATPRAKAGQSPQETRVELQQAVFAGCHGVILVYGVTPASWAGSNFWILLRTFSTVSPHGTIGVLTGPPPDTPRMEIRGPKVVPLDCTDGLKPAVLADFIQRVRQQAVADGGHV